MSQLLTETIQSPLEIVERASANNAQRYLLRVRGEFGRYDRATENGRVYRQPIWEREINRLAPSFGSRSVFGEVDHPTDGRTSLKRVSHIITTLRLEGGKVVGEAEILPTKRGRDLAALISSGCRIGVSSRGYGSTAKNSEGYDEVQEDFKLVTFDFVADPADKTAYPEVFSEEGASSPVDRLFEGAQLGEERVLSEQQVGTSGVEGVTEAVSRKREAAIRREVREEVGALFEARQAEREEALRDELSEEHAERERLLLDEQTRMQGEIDELIEERAGLQEQLETLEAANAELTEMVQRLGFESYLAQRLEGSAHAAEIRAVVGDVSGYASADEFQQRIDAVEQGILTREARKLEEERERKRVLDRHLRAQRRLEEDNRKLRDAADKSLEVAKIMGVQLYAERRLAKHPRAAQLRAVLERVQPATKAEVDELFEEFRAPSRSREAIAEATARVRNLTGGGITALPRLEEEPVERSGAAGPLEESRGGFNGLGVSLRELKRLMPSSSSTDQSNRSNRANK